MAFTTQALYREQVLQLTNSIAVKLDAEAHVANKYLTSIGHVVDKYNPRSWIYYCHLAGEYHPTDKMMRVISLDTLEEIDFTYNNLRLHRATLNAYRSKGEYYRQLVAQNMSQWDLIDGILNPINKDKAIAAKNFEILRWDKSLVNSNEYNLIPELQRWVYAYSAQWYNNNFVYLSDEYPGAFLTGMFMHMPGEIVNIRKKNTHTEMVHDYHLWAYLASHQRLDKYRDYLTREQALWLYRNIVYLEAHPGWDNTFKELIKWLLTKRGIPLTSFELAHNLENLSKQVSPAAEVLKIPLNPPAYSATGVKKESIESVLNKEIPLAKDNIDYYSEQISSVPERFKLSQFSKLQTKVLESDMVDRTDAQPVHFIQTILNEWIYLSSAGYYKANITVTNPYTAEVISMTAKESVIVWLYCLHRQMGIDIEKVPTFLAHHVMRPTAPKFTELRSMVPTKYVNEDMILAVLEEFTPPGNIISVEKFYETVTSIHNNVGALRHLYSTQENFHIRGYMENLSLRLFMETRCVLAKDTYFADLFHQKGWKLDKMSKLQYEDFGDTIFLKSTGLDLKNINSLRSIQEAMLQLLQQLSSYSIQMLSHMTDSTVTVLDRPIIRVGNVDNDSAFKARYKLRTELVGLRGESTVKANVDCGHGVTLDDSTISVSSVMQVKVNPIIAFTHNTRVTAVRRVKLPLAKISLKRAIDIKPAIEKPQLNGVWEIDPTYKEDPIQTSVEKTALDAFWPDPFVEAGLNIDETGLNGVTLIPYFVNMEQAFPNDSIGGFTISE